MRTSWILACFGMAAFVGACSSDNNTPDSPVSTADAPPSGSDGGSKSDAGAATTFTITLGPETGCSHTTGPAGTATVTVAADNTLTVTGTYSGLSATPSMGHVHFGGPSDGGPVVISLTIVAGATAGSGTFNVTHNASDPYSPKAGTPTAPADYATFISMLKTGGKTYLNFHTGDCGGGELRGEIQ